MHSEKSTDKLLYLLKSRGPQTVNQLAERLKMTSMGARQHLQALEGDGLVESESQKSPRGRPASYWQLTEAAQKRFPDSHAVLTKDLLASVQQVFGEPGLQRLIDARTAEVQKQYFDALQDCTSLEQRLDKLCEIRSAEGYMAELRHSQAGFVLVENHCPICVAASACQGLCRAELQTFQHVLGDDVEIVRQDHILAGARRCAYRITEKSSA